MAFCDPELENIMNNMKSFCVNIPDSENSKFKFVCYKYFEHFIFHKCVNKGK